MRSRGLLLSCLVFGCGLGPYASNSAGVGDTSGGTSGGSSGDVTLGGSVTGAATVTTGMVDGTGGEDTSVGGASSSGGVETCGGSGGDLRPGGWKECDPWAQDCPEGCKCMPYSGDGDNAWESLKCVPVMPNAGERGDPCTVEGSGVSGIDSCAKGHMCWNVDPETGMGRCVEQCKGTPDTPHCTDPWDTCYMASDGVLTLCLSGCHPFDKPCTDGDLCVPNPMDPNRFICVIDASGEEGQVFDVCEYANACDDGLICANPVLASECDQTAAGCCLPFCKLSMPDCPGVGLECLPWYEEGQAPPKFEDIGLCGLPQ